MENSIKNGEILFIYEAKLTNPNGDIDDENRPRMDYDSSTNLVSDVRLKRYIRDYLKDSGKNIFIDHGNFGTATEKLNTELEKNNYKLKEIMKDGKKSIDFVTKNYEDIRLFGSMIPIKSEKNEKKGTKQGDITNDSEKDENNGDSIRIVGPVQFSWGYSLNKVQLLNSYSITGGFTSSSGKKNNSIGKDYRLYYSLIAFYGIINKHRAKLSGLTENDINDLDDAMLNSIQEQASRSKINQMPVFYLRTSSDNRLLGDLRDYLKFQVNNDPVRNIKDYSLDVKELESALKNNGIEKAKMWKHENLDLIE